MTTYYVETYAGDGNYVDPEFEEHENLDSAMADVTTRLGRPVALPPDWKPDRDMHGPQIPAGALPVGAWHESESELCGGVAVWKS